MAVVCQNCLRVCVDKSNDFQFRFLGLHRSLAKQDNIFKHSIPCILKISNTSLISPIESTIFVHYLYLHIIRENLCAHKFSLMMLNVTPKHVG